MKSRNRIVGDCRSLRLERLESRVVLAAAVDFSIAGGLFDETFRLELSGPEDALLRYTTDGSLPDESSRIYRDPISISEPTWIRARAIESDGTSGPVRSESFLFVHESLTEFEDGKPFSSNLPVMFFHSFDRSPDRLTSRSGRMQPVSAILIDNDDDNGRTDLFDQPDYVGHAGMNACDLAQQTCFLADGWQKPSYHLEFWGEGNAGARPIDSKQTDEMAFPVFDAPADSDWMLLGPYPDKTLINEFLVSVWSNNAGRYAPRAQMVEVFMNDRDRAFTYPDDYQGVYVLLETIKIGDDRIDITPVSTTDNSLPELAGGYVWRKGKDIRDQASFRTEHGQNIQVVHPSSKEEITAEQLSWLQDHLAEFETALYGDQFQDPEHGYVAFIDVDSFVDEWLLVEMTKNIDGFRLDTFFYKDRDGQIVQGPPSGYSLALGNANYLKGGDAEGWYHWLLPEDNYGYWGRLWEDPHFQLQVSERWHELRESVWATDRLLAEVDQAVTLLADGNPSLENPAPGEPTNPLSRNFEKVPVLNQYLWPNCYFLGKGGDCPESPLPNGRAPETYSDYVFLLKRFIELRTGWMDSQLLSLVTLMPESGPINDQTPITMQGPPGHAIFYSTDGSDPIQDGVRYIGPVTLERTSVLSVRSFDGAARTWTPLKQQTYIVGQAGDFDHDGSVRLSDVDLLWAELGSARSNRVFDLTDDGDVDTRDRDVMIQDILMTSYGDANLDSVFNSDDLLLVFRTGQYEDAESSNSTWANGDWNGDGEFDSSDLVLAFQAGGYV